MVGFNHQPGLSPSAPGVATLWIVCATGCRLPMPGVPWRNPRPCVGWIWLDDPETMGETHGDEERRLNFFGEILNGTVRDGKWSKIYRIVAPNLAGHSHDLVVFLSNFQAWCSRLTFIFLLWAENLHEISIFQGKNIVSCDLFLKSIFWLLIEFSISWVKFLVPLLQMSLHL